MEPQLVGWAAIALLFLLLALKVPVAVCLALVGLIGLWVLQGSLPALSVVGMFPYLKASYNPLTVIPLFILMGNFAYEAGFAQDAFQTGQKWVGRFPGGLVQATLFGAAAFGACCGSGLASCATVSKVTIPEMLRVGVDKRLAFGTVAAAGGLAAMIPPSTTMVIYGAITEQSVGKLLIAGILPGIVATLWFMVMVFVRCKRNPGLAPSLRVKVSWRDRFVSLKGMWGIALLAVVIMGGIYGGIFTPTEAGAIGTFAAFVAAVAMKRLNRQSLRRVLLDTVRTTSMIFLVIVCAFIFAQLISISRIPTAVSEFLVGLEMPRLVILTGMMLLYIILGCFMDMLAALFLTLPIFVPAIINLGYSPIWFGVLIVHQIEIAWITPPFALNLYILQGTVPGTDMKDIIAGVWPFIFMDVVILATFIAFPQIALFLPDMMGK